MKKFFLFALVLSGLAFVATSCDDDDDLPNVDFSVSISGAENIDGTIYVVQGDTLSIDSLGVTNVGSNKPAAITGAEYYWDYAWIGTSAIQPYGFNIVTTPATRLGNHLLQIKTGVVAVDKAPGVAILAYNVNVVADSSEIPATPAPVNTFSVSHGMKAN